MGSDGGRTCWAAVGVEGFRGTGQRSEVGLFRRRSSDGARVRRILSLNKKGGIKDNMIRMVATNM